MLTPFKNEFPFPNFAEERSRSRMEEALTSVTAQTGHTYSLVIGGRHIETVQRSQSRNPSRLDQVIGIACESPAEMVDAAVQAAQDAFPAWSHLSTEERARYFVSAAAKMRRRIYSFAAWMVLEAGKNWTEAYADAAEAIDFMEYYAREAIRLQRSHPTIAMTGEENDFFYLPLGVGAVIAPWNFPLAILVGMTTAAAVTGNTVIMKPAEQTPVIAAKFMELLEYVGLPPGVVNYLPGDGEVVGEALTAHPQVRFVAFTGSREVGVHIYARAAVVQPGQKFLRRCILEMGGKDAIVVDENTPLDLVAAEVVASAFGFQGQKCSACSRLIAHTDIYDELLQKVIELGRKIKIGDPAQYGVYMGGVIDAAAHKKILNYVALGRAEAKLVMGGVDTEDQETHGYFVHPTIFSEVDPQSRLAQEEIFGPVLSAIRAESFEHAMEIANGTDYGLTGALFSSSRAHLEYARREFHVGNLYLNRKCTGALVGVQPFGGFNMSGTDSKAGGPDYLLQFMQGKIVCERW